jgi:hypothetical protein
VIIKNGEREAQLELEHSYQVLLSIKEENMLRENIANIQQEKQMHLL